ncbi:MAG: mechanosensitive ion channel family protein [Gammaproteobacteria bacterium]
MQLSNFLDSHAYPWLATAVAGVLAVIAALIAHAVLFAALRRLARSRTLAATLIEFTVAPARWVLPLFALQFVLEAAPSDLRFATGARNSVALLLIAAATWLGMRLVAGVGEALIRSHPADIGDNLAARRIQTQSRVLGRMLMFFVLLIGAASALMMFPSVRHLGTSLLASAGVAGLVAGIAARPVLGNLIAGLQIALTQPIRLDDVVIIENEWGRIEEITSTYVVVKIWDERRLIVPLQWIIENPFQNWTRTQAQLLGTVFLWLDYRVPLAPLRAELERVCRSASEWDQRVALLQVVDTNERAIQVRALVSAADASKSWDLRCRVREALVDFLQREYPDALPRVRAELDRAEKHPPAEMPAPPPPRAGKGDSTAIKEATHRAPDATLTQRQGN